MPQPRVSPPVAVTFHQAREIFCNQLHSDFRQRFGAESVRLTIIGGYYQNGVFKPYTPVYLIEDRAIQLSSHCEYTGMLYLVQATYTSGVRPEERLTRAQFIMEVQDRWEAMVRTLPPNLKETIGAEVDMALAYLRGTYTVDELGGIDDLEKGLNGTPPLPMPTGA